MLRQQLKADRLCIAGPSYAYNHHQRDLASRLMKTQHDAHDLNLSTMHVHSHPKR